jgi:hypothetical protein
MDEKIDAVDEATQKLIAERKARRTRFDELKCKIEENEGVLERKREAINDMQVRYYHGMIDLTFFAASDMLRARADAERNALHKLIDDMAVQRKDYDRGAEEQNKLIEESNKLCKQIEEDEQPLGGFVGGLLGGAASYFMGRALSKVGEKKEAPATEPAPPPESGGTDGGSPP